MRSSFVWIIPVMRLQLAWQGELPELALIIKPITIRDLLNTHNGQSCVLFFNPYIDVIFRMIFPHQIT